jgi:hypothetical protein
MPNVSIILQFFNVAQVTSNNARQDCTPYMALKKCHTQVLQKMRRGSQSTMISLLGYDTQQFGGYVRMFQQNQSSGAGEINKFLKEVGTLTGDFYISALS